jgi:hypothetical protein
MISELHEVTAISKHDRCFSKSVYDTYEIGCTCKTDTVETRIVGTESYRNWEFPKGRCPLQIGQQLTLEQLNRARTSGVIEAAEAKKTKPPTAEEKGA